ncbi:MAG: class I SAM-dependent methyltransferase [Terriglobales bacterium]
MTTTTRDEQLRAEFNQWAREGHGEAMERHHFRIAQKTIQHMQLAPQQRILELGCGDGWACRLLARLLDSGSQLVGMDISDEMIRQARNKSTDFGNVSFLWGSAESIPWQDDYFTKAWAIESFYYYEHQEKVLDELKRVLAPMARLFLVMCIYKENTDTLRWVEQANVPIHVRSAQEYQAMLAARGWIEVAAEEFFPEAGAPPETRSHDRALLLTARKPHFVPPGLG